MMPTVRQTVDPASLIDSNSVFQNRRNTILTSQNDSLQNAIAARLQRQNALRQQEQQAQYDRIRAAAEAAQKAAAANAAKLQQQQADMQRQQQQQFQSVLSQAGGSAYAGGPIKSSGQGVSYKPGDTAGGDTSIWGDPRSAGWASQNLVTFKNGKQNVTVNRAAASAFQGFLHALTSSGYKTGTVQGYNLRNKRTNNTLSEHAFGTAIDINPAQNPATRGVLKTNMPTWVGALAAKYGLIWGGTWQKTPDPMHFEYVAPSRRK